MPHAILVSDTQIVGFDPSRPQPFSGGWIEVSPSQFAEARSTPRAQWVAGEIVSGPVPSPPVPREVAHWRIAHILSEEGQLSSAEDFIAAIPLPDGAIAAAAWAGKSAVSRRSSLVVAVAASLGYSAAAMDSVFIRAEAIPT